MRGGDGASDPIWLSEEGIHEMPMNPYIFKYATAVRDSVTKEQQAYIEEAYKKWSEDVLEQAEYYSKLTTGSSPVSQAYYQQLYQQMQAQSKEIANGVYTNITNGMAQVSDAVVKDAVDWMSGFGFSKKGLDAAFSYIPQSTVNSLITGSVYGKPGSWSLSAAIWGDNEKTLRDIYSIMGQGIAAQMPIEDIAKKLSQYVDPNKQLSWTGPNGMRIYKHAVDYNAQRLARTLVQHTYQQSFVAATKDNPFVTEYVWIANGSRVCPICADRDGTHYKKDKLPLDHPNGMCTMEPVVDDDIADKLANWVNSEDGTYPEIDAFASKFGYDATKLPKMTLADIKKQYGNSHYKSPSAWYKNLPKDVQQTVSQIHQASGKKWTQWYQDEMMDQSLKKMAKKNVDKKIAKKAAGDNGLLDNLLGRFKNQTVDKMLSLEDKTLGRLTKTQIEILKDYTGSSYESFNAYLRQKVAGEAYTGYLSKDKINELEDAVKAFSKIKTNENYVLRRGTDANDIVYTFLNGDTSTREKMQNLIYDIEGDLFGPGGKVDEAKLQEHIGEINSLIKGQVGSFGSFTSTSSDWSKGFANDVEYVIDAPKGTAGTSVMSISKYGTQEGEFLLAPGTKVICEKVEAAKDGHKKALVRVFLKIIV